MINVEQSEMVCVVVVVAMQLLDGTAAAGAARFCS
jgi:hypothetical protein